MFTLAHLSDPHLAPLPKPRWRDLIGKRVTGYINWQRNRRFVHDAEVLGKIVADLKAQAPDHIAVTGDLSNIALEEEFARGRKWLQDLGSLHDVSLVPGNHDAYVRQAVRYAPQWAPYMSGDDGGAGFPYLRRRGPLALVGLSTAVTSAWGMATGRLGSAQLTRLGDMLGALAPEKTFPRRADPPSAGEPGQASQASDRRRGILARHRRARRRTGAARPRSSAHDQLARRPERDARAGGRRAVGLGRVRREQTRRRL